MNGECFVTLRTERHDLHTWCERHVLALTGHGLHNQSGVILLCGMSSFNAQTATRGHRSELMQTDGMSKEVAKHSSPRDM